jgi:hypothetical protein
MDGGGTDHRSTSEDGERDRAAAHGAAPTGSDIRPEPAPEQARRACRAVALGFLRGGRNTRTIC